MIPPEELKAWREIEEKATEGPWKSVSGSAQFDTPSIEKVKGGVLGRTTHHGKMREDALLIVTARNTYAQLLDEVERLNRVIAKELSENDEFGCEYTYVSALKDEVERLQIIIQDALPFVRHTSACYAALGTKFQDIAEEWIQKVENECT